LLFPTAEEFPGVKTEFQPTKSVCRVVFRSRTYYAVPVPTFRFDVDPDPNRNSYGKFLTYIHGTVVLFFYIGKAFTGEVAHYNFVCFDRAGFGSFDTGPP
jgi:hypothetical protein